MAKGQSRLDITKDGKGIGINLDHGMNMIQKAIYFGLNITRRPFIPVPGRRYNEIRCEKILRTLNLLI
jgi:hypothetical protein